jgi:hypothetical protein
MPIITKSELNKRIYERIQCLLMSVADVIATRTNDVYNRQDLNRKTNNIIILEEKQAEIVTAMSSKKGVREFFELTTAQISCLSPRIRLFKNWVNKNKPDSEFHFSSHFMGDNLFPRDGVYQYLGNVGIKNFEFVNQGTDFATNYLYKCSIELAFGNIEELTALHTTDDGEKISFLDLLLPPTRVSDEEHFRIKAVLGFSRPSGPINHDVDGEESALLPEAINSFIDSWNFVMYLNRINYNFTFNENGKITLKIDFISSLDRILESEESDILLSPEIRRYNEIVSTLKSEIQTFESKLQQEILPGVAKAIGGKDFSPFAKILVTDSEGNLKTVDSDLELTKYVQLSQQEKDKYLEDLGLESAQFKPTGIDDKTYAMSGLNNLEMLAENLREIQTILNDKIDERHQKIFAKLFEGQRLFYFDIFASQILGNIFQNITTFQDDDFFLTSEINIEDAIDNFRKNFGNLKIFNYSNQEMQSYIGDYIDEERRKKRYDEERSQDSSDIYSTMASDYSLDKINSFLSGDITTDSFALGSIRVDFILFGDLIQKVFDILLDNGAPLNHYAILLGDIAYNINGEKVRINIADLPISKQIFLDWYNKDIFDAKKSSLKVRDFLIAMLRKVLPAAINEGCFGQNTRYMEEIEIKAFTITKEKADKLLSRPLSRFDLRELMERSQGITFRTPQDTMDIIYIKSQDFSINNLRANYEEDMERGIYHFYIANNTGIVKKINFNKVDDQNIIASNIQNAVDKKEFNAKTITTFYDANIEMVGNTFFTPGQIIYINPTFAGLGNPQLRTSIAQQIGIGGYYDVLQVKHNIKPGQFQTTIRAKWKGFKGDEYIKSKNIAEGKKIYQDALAKSAENKENLAKIASQIKEREEKGGGNNDNISAEDMLPFGQL